MTNRKPANRKGKVQLIDASAMWQEMRKSLGSKRKGLSDEHIAEITRLFGNAKEVNVNEDGRPVAAFLSRASCQAAGLPFPSTLPVSSGLAPSKQKNR
ncbi:hypothetical protein Q31b_12660 [Novipirellula aureliae]|uniref:Uncharacterized protein n=1 Tax=Novipirellula aureliae TaxID=2527966 RepID=A0A5C6E727_9BACT|nr:SAM-dependent methyltransferase [Novipirellula aureliae]TWU43737.1 hypothetical protein Q31b_12660 [Novipirellula aureliae]